MMKVDFKRFDFLNSPIVYKCDPEKNKACTKESCQTLCFFSLNPLNSVDGRRYRYNDKTGKEEPLDT